MNMHQLAEQAYAAPNGSVRTPKRIEHEAFARVTRALSAFLPPQRDSSFPNLVRAVHANRRLWTLLAGAAADAENALPADLRARILYLAEFTRRQSAEILRRRRDPSVLVEINTAVMAGLRDPGRAATDAPSPAPRTAA